MGSKIDKLIKQYEVNLHNASVDLAKKGIIPRPKQGYINDLCEQIKSALLECVPEEREELRDPQTGAPVGMDGCINHGFNKARQEMLDNINQLFKESGDG